MIKMHLTAACHNLSCFFQLRLFLSSEDARTDDNDGRETSQRKGISQSNVTSQSSASSQRNAISLSQASSQPDDDVILDEGDLVRYQL